MSKKKILLLVSIVLILSCAAVGTYAYFTAAEVAHNVITTGKVDIDLIEEASTEEGTVPFEDMDGVLPGMEASKIVTVDNIGVGDAWVRIAVKKEIQLHPDAEVVEDINLELIELDIDEENWIEQEEDGVMYYYYAKQLKPGESTTPLFTTVTFDETMGNMYQKSKAFIHVRAEAVQVANNAEAGTVLEAAGWPAPVTEPEPEPVPES